MPRHPIAHTKAGSPDTHDLRDHLEGVARRGCAFADRWGAGELAALTGLWHDLGKYSNDFQNMIRAAENEDGHLEGADSSPKQWVNHSSAGALHALTKFGEKGLTMAFVIAGHHAGLADFNEELASRLKNIPDNARLLSEACRNAPRDLLDAGSKLPLQRPSDADPSLWIRMLFSAVCDADFLDTEAFGGRIETSMGLPWSSPAPHRPLAGVRIETLGFPPSYWLGFPSPPRWGAD